MAREGQGYPCCQHDMMMMMMICTFHTFIYGYVTICLHTSSSSSSSYRASVKFNNFLEFSSGYIYTYTIYIYIYKFIVQIYMHKHVQYHHHHIALVARISLTLSRHSSLSFIALGRSSGQHPVSSHSC